MSKKIARTKPGTSSAKERKALFAETYLANGGNATQAAIAAGYAPKSAYVTGSRLLKDVQVREVISQRGKAALEAAMTKTDVTAEEIVRSAARAVRFDLRKMFREDGTPKTLAELDDEAALVLELSGGKLKLDRNAPREQLMKHFGLYEKDNEQQRSQFNNLLVTFV